MELAALIVLGLMSAIAAAAAVAAGVVFVEWLKADRPVSDEPLDNGPYSM